MPFNKKNKLCFSTTFQKKNYKQAMLSNKKKIFIPPMRNIAFRVNATKGINSFKFFNKKSTIKLSYRKIPFYLFN